MKFIIINVVTVLVMAATIGIVSSCNSDDDEVAEQCQTNLDCLTNQTEKDWKLSGFGDTPQSEWNDCMKDLIMTIKADGRWSYTCPVNQMRAGKWWFSEDETIYYTSPAITLFWHGDADTVAYEIVTIDDNSFAYKAPPDNKVERFRAQ